MTERMVTRHVHGYLVVSPAKPPLSYRGVDRDPLDVVGDDFYRGSLPGDLRAAYKRCDERGTSRVWMPYCEGVDEARVFLRYTRARVPDAELVAFSSAYLSDAPTFAVPDGARWLGVDVVAPGEWSLLKEMSAGGVPWGDSNLSGLLEDEGQVAEVEARYRALTLQGLVEEIAAPDDRLPVSAVHVYASP